MTSLPARAARHCHAALNPLHSALYFSPDLTSAFARHDVDARGAYFAARAAPLGAVGAGVVTATFYNFQYAHVARHIPDLWDSVSPEQALETRLSAADATLRRLLGEEAIASKELAEAAELALRAAEAGTRAARPLYAANAGLPVPREPHLALWHAATQLREHRGDGHLAALVTAGLGPVDALVSHTASSRGMAEDWVRASRGWNQEEWQAGQERLRARGLLDGADELTPAGTELRKTLEEETDRLDLAPYEGLGAAGVARLTELAGALTATAVAAGAFPAGIFGTR
ncbi:SCO6745 family protein [Streptomyces corynorhini]|uniref:SalK n=1 Tax=Streptomyces corynorhini TaxID=2282652 RepID=A0A370B483_9ACTN|nr:hypothetical protein [Streptomyces corynorhini]RDG34663.1 hypothetical protein DVH02_29540 [Streptomyces corynorhini]